MNFIEIYEIYGLLYEFIVLASYLLTKVYNYRTYLQEFIIIVLLTRIYNHHTYLQEFNHHLRTEFNGDFILFITYKSL